MGLIIHRILGQVYPKRLSKIADKTEHEWVTTPTDMYDHIHSRRGLGHVPYGELFRIWPNMHGKKLVGINTRRGPIIVRPIDGREIHCYMHDSMQPYLTELLQAPSTLWQLERFLGLDYVEGTGTKPIKTKNIGDLIEEEHARMTKVEF